jgi:hypothetical protein
MSANVPVKQSFRINLVYSSHWTDLEMPEEESKDEANAKSHEPSNKEE